MMRRRPAWTWSSPAAWTPTPAHVPGLPESWPGRSPPFATARGPRGWRRGGGPRRTLGPQPRLRRTSLVAVARRPGERPRASSPAPCLAIARGRGTRCRRRGSDRGTSGHRRRPFQPRCRHTPHRPGRPSPRRPARTLARQTRVYGRDRCVAERWRGARARPPRGPTRVSRRRARVERLPKPRARQAGGIRRRLPASRRCPSGRTETERERCHRGPLRPVRVARGALARSVWRRSVGGRFGWLTVGETPEREGGARRELPALLPALRA